MSYKKKFLTRFMYILYLSSLLSFLSCEEVIKIDLNSVNPFLVTEGVIQSDSAAWIKISYTTDYFTSRHPQYVENATVTLTDDIGNYEILKYKGGGLYRGVSVKGKPDRLYALNIRNNDFNYTASSNLISAPRIYSVKFEKSVRQFPGEEIELYLVILRFSDDLFTENFYNIEFLINGKPDDYSYTLIADSYFADNDAIVYSPRWRTFESGDIITIRVYSIDRNTYAYYSQLNDILETGMGGSSTPYNPVSNFGTSVMGYFRAYSFTSYTVRVE